MRAVKANQKSFSLPSFLAIGKLRSSLDMLTLYLKMMILFLFFNCIHAVLCVCTWILLSPMCSGLSYTFNLLFHLLLVQMLTTCRTTVQ